jgi:hypothetical protein
MLNVDKYPRELKVRWFGPRRLEDEA